MEPRPLRFRLSLNGDLFWAFQACGAITVIFFAAALIASFCSFLKKTRQYTGECYWVLLHSITCRIFNARNPLRWQETPLSARIVLAMNKSVCSRATFLHTLLNIE